YSHNTIGSVSGVGVLFRSFDPEKPDQHNNEDQKHLNSSANSLHVPFGLDYQEGWRLPTWRNNSQVV
ncbi:hypothetical protein, partial [Gilvimarinus sp. 1_MG-2023]|uniref:hypothetical protein n=1 Tax=Gilvimarinus sp. 1_MG-2023 TaxID=3062638 RepID=UPI0026E479BA